jgi:hypothetical protein
MRRRQSGNRDVNTFKLQDATTWAIPSRARLQGLRQRIIFLNRGAAFSRRTFASPHLSGAQPASHTA